MEGNLRREKDPGREERDLGREEELWSLWCSERKLLWCSERKLLWWWSSEAWRQWVLLMRRRKENKRREQGWPWAGWAKAQDPKLLEVQFFFLIFNLANKKYFNYRIAENSALHYSLIPKVLKTFPRIAPNVTFFPVVRLDMNRVVVSCHPKGPASIPICFYYFSLYLFFLLSTEFIFMFLFFLLILSQFIFL